MTRITTSLLAIALLFAQSALGGEKSTSAKQRFTVRVMPKVAVEMISAASNTQTEAKKGSDQLDLNTTGDVAFRVSGTGSSGLHLQFESRSKSTEELNTTKKPLSLRVVSGNEYWTVDEDEIDQRTEKDSGIVQASSNGIGTATVILSTNYETADFDVIMTVISKD